MPGLVRAGETMQVKGFNGTVTFDGTFVTITRTGFRARISVGSGFTTGPR
jgi:hypothetical protein